MTYKVSCRYWSEDFTDLKEAVEACINERERSLSEDFGDYYEYADDEQSGAELCEISEDGSEEPLDVCDFEKID